MSAILPAIQVAEQLGLRRYVRSWRGECPNCAYQSTFSVKPGRDGRALCYCASCGDADGIRAAIKSRLGIEQKPAEQPVAADLARTRAVKLEAAGKLWRGAEPIGRTRAAAYLAARGISAIADAPALRWRRDVTHPESRGFWPAMAAEVVDADGAFTGVHRTYLRGDGTGIADVFPAKASLGPIWGGAVRLAVPLPSTDAPQLVIGEGIESAASAGILLNLPAWAALSAGNLATGLMPPPHVRNIIIAADHDLPDNHGRQPGQDAAKAAVKRWRAEGRTVSVALPDAPGDDFNDVLLRGAQHA